MTTATCSCGEGKEPLEATPAPREACCRLVASRPQGGREFDLFSPRADYTYTIEDGVVCIIDSGVGRSVTNDAAAVIEDLAMGGIKLHKTAVIYRDTRGVWDQLVVRGGRFAGFKSLNELEREAAIAKVRAR